MCGIAGIYVKDPKVLENPKTKESMERMLDELLLGIENRGTDATGFVAATQDKTTVIDKSPVEASKFIKVRKKLPENSRIVLGHTRLATKGKPDNHMNNHPVIYEGVMVTHNGIITNDDSIFKDEKLRRYAEVDTEAIAALLRQSGLEDPGETLSKLRGVFSCAAFDVSEPSKLILFKKGSNPLVYHENKQFIVWASTANAIKEAWGKVLGTPPKWAKFEHMKDGSIIHIEDDELVVSENAIKGATFQSNAYSNWSPQDWESWDIEGECEAPIYLDRSTDYSATSRNVTRISGLGEARTLTSIVDECRLAVNAKKERLAITFDDRVKLSAEQIVDMKKNKPAWAHCELCKTTVAKTDTKAHLVHGWICLDCYDYLTKKTEREYPGKERARVYSDLETIDQIDEWVQLESYIHYNTMQRVEDFTGMSMNTIEFLLFRASDAYLKPDNVKILFNDLKYRYEEENATVWELYGNQFDKENPVELTPTIKPSENKWVSCASGVHLDTDDCKACKDVEKASRTLEGSVIVGQKPIVKCRHIGCLTKDTCEREVEPKPLADRIKGYKSRMDSHKKMWAPGDPIVGREKRDGKCLLCTKNAKVLISQDYRWCVMHYTFCGFLADDKSDCSNDPVGWNEFGVRVCHHHSRGMKNFMTTKSVNAIRERAKSKV